MKTYIQGIKNWIKRALLPKVHSNFPDTSASPIFIIGTNRSGTSVVSKLLSQHPDLEGLFAGNKEPHFKEGAKHARGYCESYHLWTWLNSITSEFHSSGDHAPLWCHPQYLSQNYRSSIRDKSEAIDLLNSIEKHRKTKKNPLIKDQLNLLRLGLIKDIYPNARIVFVIRDFDDYLPSCYDTWFANKDFLKIPSIAQHWLTGNQVALYDLKTYFQDNYFVINYNDLLKGNDICKDILKNLCKKLNLTDYDFDLSMISSKFRFIKEARQSNIRIDEALMKNIYQIEKKFLNELQ